MPCTDKMLRSEVRKLARKGRLLDEAFKMFSRVVYPGAPPEQVAVMRVCFMAGAAELQALQMAAMDLGNEPTDGDLDFYDQVTVEIQRFHERTIATATAMGTKN